MGPEGEDVREVTEAFLKALGCPTKMQVIVIPGGLLDLEGSDEAV